MSLANNISYVSDRVDRAKSFLLTQFKDKPNINAFVEVVVEELQELEKVLTDLQEVRTLEGSYGPYLDEIGNQLRVGRGSYTDSDYKNAIKIAMAKKTSSATAEDILFIVDLLTGDSESRIENNYPYLLELTGYLFCIAESEEGLSELADLFPVNSRVRIIQRYATPFKFGTPNQGFGKGTLNSLVYHRYGDIDDPRFTTFAGTAGDEVQGDTDLGLTDLYGFEFTTFSGDVFATINFNPDGTTVSSTSSNTYPNDLWGLEGDPADYRIAYSTLEGNDFTTKAPDTEFNLTNTQSFTTTLTVTGSPDTQRGVYEFRLTKLTDPTFLVTQVVTIDLEALTEPS